MSEKEVEAYLKSEVEKLNGLCWKFTSPGTAGVPDRVIVSAKGKVYFVEVKQQGKKLRPLQERRMRELSVRGCRGYIVDSKDEVDFFIKELICHDAAEALL